MGNGQDVILVDDYRAASKVISRQLPFSRQYATAVN